MKHLFLFLMLILTALTAVAAENSPVTAFISANKVTNLTLPPNFEVKPDEGFAVIKAECKGTVKWLVVSQKSVKYIPIDTTNTLILGIPTNGSVNVFAVGLCDGKLTDFAQTVVTVKSIEELKPRSVAFPIKE